MLEPLIKVQLVYARPTKTFLFDLAVAPGSTVQDVITASGIKQQAPEIDLLHWRVGIFAKLKPLSTPVRAGDRVEIYRPLIADPKDSRRKRAAVKADSLKSG
jgi:uncharacterized protein